MKTRVLTLVAPALLIFGGIADAQSIRGDFADFSAGKLLRYSTKGHPKAGTLDLSIKYPIGWKIEEGEKPHIVKKIMRSIGLMQYSLMISVSDMMEGFNALSAKDMEEMFQDPKWAEELYPAPAIVHSQSMTKFEARPAGIAEVTQFAERLGVRLKMRNRVLVFFCDDRMVFVSGSVSTVASNVDELDAKFDEARPLFYSIFNGATLNNAWAAAPVAAEQNSNRAGNGYIPVRKAPDLISPVNPLGEPAGKGFWPAFLISLVLTWTIGLLPAVLLRFVGYRRPIPAKLATIYAVAISAVFWLLGLALHDAAGETGTYRGIVWFIMFGVSRGILGWGAATPRPASPAPTVPAFAQPPSDGTPMMAIPVVEVPVYPASSPPAPPAPRASTPQVGGPPPPRPLGQPTAKLPPLPPPLPPKKPPGTN